MRVVPIDEDGKFDQFVEEEEVIYVNYGFKMSRDKDGYFCDNMDYEEINVELPMANPMKDLAKMIDAIENFSCHYKVYPSLGEEICKSIPFEYFNSRFGFEPKNVYD